MFLDSTVLVPGTGSQTDFCSANHNVTQVIAQHGKCLTGTSIKTKEHQHKRYRPKVNGRNHLLTTRTNKSQHRTTTDSYYPACNHSHATKKKETTAHLHIRNVAVTEPKKWIDPVPSLTATAYDSQQFNLPLQQMQQSQSPLQHLHHCSIVTLQVSQVPLPPTTATTTTAILSDALLQQAT